MTKSTRNTNGAASGSPRSSPGLPRLEFEPDRYREHLEGRPATKDQEDALLGVLWNIMHTMVDMGWGVETVQMFLPDLFEKASADSDKLLEQRDTPPINDKRAASDAAGKESEHDR